MGASAEISPRASLGILAYARGVRRKDCGSAEDVLLRSAEVSKREVRKSIANSSSNTSGVARCYPTATSERGCGWVGYLPLNYNARSEASEHAFARRVIPRQDPIHLLINFGTLYSGCTPRAFGALLTALSTSFAGVAGRRCFPSCCLFRTDCPTWRSSRGFRRG